MAAAYPSGVKTFTTKTNKVDLVDADHINDLQLEVVAIQEELGTDVAGSAATLKIRLAVNTAADGGIVSGGADPGGSLVIVTNTSSCFSIIYEKKMLTSST